MVLTSSLYHKLWTNKNKPLVHAYCFCSAGNLQMATVHTVSCSSLSCSASRPLPLRHWLLQTDMQDVPQICCGPPQGAIHPHLKNSTSNQPALSTFSCMFIRLASFVPSQSHCTASLCMTAGSVDPVASGVIGTNAQS